MTSERILQDILGQFDAVLAQEPASGLALWQRLLDIHPADIALFMSNSLSPEQMQQLFIKLPQALQLTVFQDLTDSLKVFCLSFLDDQGRAHILNGTPLDELTDLFDRLSDEELKQYLRFLHKQDRDTVLSLLKFNPESAGGIMDTDVLTLMEDFTVEKSVRVLQRLQPDQELHRRIFVTNQDNQLVGCINIEDLVLKHPTARLSSFARPIELVVHANEDQEAVAHNMVHYGLMTVPVVGDNNVFLGVIASDTLVDVIEREASEDVYKMAAMAPIKQPYFEAPFFRMLYERSSILIVLLIAQTVSTLILERYEPLLCGFLSFFTTMLISAGGNASSQTSSIVIQGIASGELNAANAGRFVRRELSMASIMAFLLGCVAFIRIMIVYGPAHVWKGIAVSLSLSAIVMVAVVLGSCLPLVLKKLRLDPAFSAGPGLATLMDILGLLIYCLVSSFILSF